MFAIENQQNRSVTSGFIEKRAYDFSRFSPKTGAKIKIARHRQVKCRFRLVGPADYEYDNIFSNLRCHFRFRWQNLDKGHKLTIKSLQIWGTKTLGYGTQFLRMSYIYHNNFRFAQSSKWDADFHPSAKSPWFCMTWKSSNNLFCPILSVRGDSLDFFGPRSISIFLDLGRLVEWECLHYVEPTFSKKS